MSVLTDEQMEKARVEHFRTLNQLDIEAENKKDWLAGYREMIGHLKEKELELRRMVQTGQAEPEQLLLFGGPGDE